MVVNWVWFCAPGDIWQYLETFFYCHDWETGCCSWHLMGRDQGCRKHTVIHKAAPTMKNHPAPSVHSARTEKSWSRVTKAFGLRADSQVEGGIIFRKKLQLNSTFLLNQCFKSCIENLTRMLNGRLLIFTSAALCPREDKSQAHSSRT